MRAKKVLLRGVISSLLAIVTVLTGSNGVMAYSVSDDGEAVHEYIAEQALALYSNAELSAYFADIRAGAGHEDVKDHIYDLTGPVETGAFTTITHFWDADNGPDDPVTYDPLPLEFSNAWQKAQVLWGMALGEYQSGDKTTAYEYLGHVAHLLADMTVPAHVHEEMHFPFDICYENWMTLANATLSQAEKDWLAGWGPIEIPDGLDDPLYYLFYTTNQIGDFFPSDRYDGDTVDNSGWMNDIYQELDMYSITKPRTADDLKDNDYIGPIELPDGSNDYDNNDDGDLGVIRYHSYLYSIRAVAALYKLFEETTSTHSSLMLTVVIDRVMELEAHDDLLGEPDFFVKISINGLQFMNEGNQVIDTIDISPGWAFARNVGTMGSVPVRIELWDEDNDPNPDDESDINPIDGKRSLDLTVDLGSGVISGDLSGTCWNTLMSSGTEDDRSRLWFRIMLSNILPSDSLVGSLVKDINPGSAHSAPNYLTYVNGIVYFTAWDGTHGTELWKSDGTTNGTVLVKDISPSDNPPSYPRFLTAVNNTLFFVANDGTNGRELWKSDGTTAGTVMVKDIAPNYLASGADELTNMNGTLFFKGNDGNGWELWKSDGTEAGTVMVKKICSFGGSLTAPWVAPSFLTDVDGILFFGAWDDTHGLELWKSDGSEAGTVMVKDIRPDDNSLASIPCDLINVNGTLFFREDDGVHGWELWKSDGTAGGTVLIKDINPGSAGSFRGPQANVNGTLFFGADDGTHGIELWKSDGTADGTVLVKDITPGLDGTMFGYQMINVNGTLFFSAYEPTHGWELWKSDGTEAGTVMVKDINPYGSAGPGMFTNLNNVLYFWADDGIHGYEPWRSDGTLAGTVLVDDVNPGSGESSVPAPGHPTVTSAGTAIFFNGITSTTGAELWKLDTPAPPFVNTEDATTITSSSANLTGNLTSLGKASSAYISFEYGLTSGYGSTTAIQIQSSTGTFTANITGLTPGTTYHFRAKAAGYGTCYGLDMSFTTPPTPSTVPKAVALTADPVNVTANGTSTSLLTANVTDQSGSPVPDGTNVVFSTNHGTLGSSTVTKQTTGGVAVANLTSESNSETVVATVTAKADNVSDVVAVFFIPEGGVNVTESQTATITGSGNITNVSSGVDVSINATGGHNITIAKYADNPGVSVPGGFTSLGKYIDVNVDNTTGVNEIEIRSYYTLAEVAGLDEASLKLASYNGTAWVTCSDSGATYPAGEPTYRGYVWAKIRSDTTPSLADLYGTPFVGIGTPPAPPSGGGVGDGGAPPDITLSLTGLTATRSLIVDYQGVAKYDCQLKTQDNRLTLDITKSTRLRDAQGNPVRALSAATEPSPPALPSGKALVMAYNFGPDGATFVPAITLTATYDPQGLPAGVAEEDVYVACWDGSQWSTLETTLNPEANMLSCQISHFTIFAVIGTITPPSLPVWSIPSSPAPAAFSVSNLTIQPAEVESKQMVTITISVANTGGTKGSYTVVLKINGVKETEESVTIDADSSQEVSFNVIKADAGTYNVVVDGLSGSFTVATQVSPAAPVEEEEAMPAPAKPFNWPLVIGIIVAIIVVALLIFFLVRRRA